MYVFYCQLEPNNYEMKLMAVLFYSIVKQYICFVKLILVLRVHGMHSANQTLYYMITLSVLSISTFVTHTISTYKKLK